MQKSTITRRCLCAIAVASAMAVAAACAGPSGSPTAPDSVAALSGRGATNLEDPCGPEGQECPPPPDTCGGPELPECPSGRFTGGGFQINTVKVTRGFTLHCDELLSNNFEVNWPDGNNFHIDKNPSVVECRLDADPVPPAAPVNRIEIIGPGTLNGVPGVIAHVVLVDHGERKNAPLDQAYISIGGVNLTGGSAASPPPLDGGNIQAHFDQPHK
jgi:hypothetical protein